MPDRAVTTDDLQKTLDWLVEQRQVDHDRIMQIARFIEALDARFRDFLEAQANSALQPPARGPDARPSNPLQDLIEQVARLDRVVDDHVTAQIRAGQVEAAQRERDRRQLGEIAQLVETTSRATDAVVGRVTALAEEVRRERDARTPLGHGIEEIQRAVAALNSRVMALDEQTRRVGNNQSVTEGVLDKHRSEVSRLDNAVKILDLRMGRDLGEIRQVVGQWQEQAVEQLKPIAGITKQLVVLAEQRDALEARLSQVYLEVAAQRDELERLDATIRSDRTAFNRISEAAELQTRRAEQSEAVAWQLSERVEALADNLARLDRETRSVDQLVDEATRRIIGVDAERGQLAEALRALAEATHEQFLAVQSRADATEQQLASAIRTLADEARERAQVNREHLRRTVGELSRQLLELDGAPSAASPNH
ncbi:MAG TPA: hypothetical protein VFZ25_13780 [Chloroflexota bacterium]|nr:hypothetical protein [Chloroflexota bacterium]